MRNLLAIIALVLFGFWAVGHIFGDDEPEPARPSTLAPTSRSVDLSADLATSGVSTLDGLRAWDFTLTLKNAGIDTAHVFAFVHASNDNIIPPARGVYPTRALRMMGSRKQLRAYEVEEDPQAGHEMAVPPAGSAEVAAGIPWSGPTPDHVKVFVASRDGRVLVNQPFGL